MLHILLQEDLHRLKIPDFLRNNSIREWVYIGEDTTWRVMAEVQLSAHIPRGSLAQSINESAVTLRQHYIDWVGDLSIQNNSFEWWSSEIAAKNPYHFFFLRICLLDAAKKWLASGIEGNILVICSTPAIMETFRNFAKDSGHTTNIIEGKTLLPDREILKTRCIGYAKKITRTIPLIPALAPLLKPYRQLIDSDIRYRQNILKKHGVDLSSQFSGEKTILLFTWADRRNFGPNSQYQDPYFGPLPMLLQKNGYEVALVPRILYTIPFEEAVEKMIQTGERFFFFEQFISPHDLKSLKSVKNLFSPVIPDSAMIGKIPVYNLAREHIHQTNELLMENLIFEPVVKRMSSAGIVPHQIIHTCEGHSWEQALAWCVRKYMPTTKIVGYDNVTFSRMVLSMYPAKSEHNLRPMPDRIVTNGPLFKKILINEGYPQDRVQSGCAIRHTYLWKTEPVPQSDEQEKTDGPVRILVATAIGLGDSVELIAKTADAFAGNNRYEVLIKCHPIVDPEEVKRILVNKLKGKNIHFTSLPISDLLPKTDVLLYTYTSVCYEALKHGVVPICVEPENFLNLDKLDSVPEIRWSVTTPDELLRAVTEIVAMTQEKRSDWKQKAMNIAHEALAPVTETCVQSFIIQS